MVNSIETEFTIFEFVQMLKGFRSLRRNRRYVDKSLALLGK